MQLSKMNIYGIYTWTNLGNNFRNYKRRIRSSRLGITSDVTLVSQKCICTDFLWNQVDYLSLFLAVTPLRERYLQRNILFIRKKGEPINSPSSDPAGTRTQDPNIKSVVLYRLSYWILQLCFSIAVAKVYLFVSLTNLFRIIFTHFFHEKSKNFIMI